MINSNELRIGNWVFVYNEIEQIFMISGMGVNDEVVNFSEVATDFKDLFSIPLTAEWLLKFGFTKHGEFYIKEKFPISINISLRFKTETIGMNEEYNVEIKYVHKLQNLYFALTGEELEIINQ